MQLTSPAVAIRGRSEQYSQLRGFFCLVLVSKSPVRVRYVEPITSPRLAPLPTRTEPAIRIAESLPKPTTLRQYIRAPSSIAQFRSPCHGAQLAIPRQLVRTLLPIH